MRRYVEKITAFLVSFLFASFCPNPKRGFIGSLV
jgi:hypothetical protein